MWRRGPRASSEGAVESGGGGWIQREGQGRGVAQLTDNKKRECLLYSAESVGCSAGELPTGIHINPHQSDGTLQSPVKGCGQHGSGQGHQCCVVGAPCDVHCTIW